MVWKVAGEFVSPKNITLGSNRPWLVMNAAFHSSPFLIRTLLYPHWMSNLENRVAPLTRLDGVPGYRGSGVAVLYCPFIYPVVVLDGMKLSVLLFDEKEGCGVWAF